MFCVVSFYIILRGKVSIMVKEDGEQDDDSDDEGNTLREHLQKASLENKQEVDRTKLGHFVGHLSKALAKSVLLFHTGIRQA